METDEYAINEDGYIMRGSTGYSIEQIIELLNLKNDVIIALRDCMDSYKNLIDLEKEKIQVLEEIAKGLHDTVAAIQNS